MLRPGSDGSPITPPPTPTPRQTALSYTQAPTPQPAAPRPPYKPADTTPSPPPPPAPRNPEVDPPRIASEFLEAPDFATTQSIRADYAPFDADHRPGQGPITGRVRPQAKVLLGLHGGATHEEIARQLQAEVVQAENHAQTLPPDRAWKGLVKTENDTQEALTVLKNEALYSTLADWSQRTGLSPADLIAAHTGESSPLPTVQQAALQQSLRSILENPAYHLPTERHYRGKVIAGQQELADYTLRRSRSGRMEVYFNLKDGTTHLTHITPVTDADILSETDRVKASLDNSASQLRQAQADLAYYQNRYDKTPSTDRYKNTLLANINATKKNIQTIEVAAQPQSDRMRQLILDGRRLLLSERVTEEAKKPQWRGKIGQYDGLAEVGKGALGGALGIGSTYASLTGDEEMQRHLAQLAEDMELVYGGSTRRQLEGGWWNNVVINTQRGLGEELFTLPLTAATGGSSSIARRTGQEITKKVLRSRLLAEAATSAAQTYGSNVLDTNQRILEAETTGNTEAARRLKEGRVLRGLLSAITGHATSKITPFTRRGSTLGNNAVQGATASTIEGLTDIPIIGQGGIDPAATSEGIASNAILNGLTSLPGRIPRRHTPSSHPETSQNITGQPPTGTPHSHPETSQNINHPSASPPPIWKGIARHGEDASILHRNPDGTFQVRLNGQEKTFKEPQVAAMLWMKKPELYAYLDAATAASLEGPRPTRPPIWQGIAHHGEDASILYRNPNGTFQVRLNGEEKTFKESQVAAVMWQKKPELYAHLHAATQQQLAADQATPISPVPVEEKGASGAAGPSPHQPPQPPSASSVTPPQKPTSRLQFSQPDQDGSQAGQAPSTQPRTPGQAMQALAEDETRFRRGPASQSKDLGEIAKDYDLGDQVDFVDETTSFQDPAAHKVEQMHLKNGASAYLFHGKDGTVWMDREEMRVSGTDPAQGGDLVTQAFMTYAHNNGLRVRPDPLAVSDIARQRDLSHMLSSSLRHRSTGHLMPNGINPKTGQPFENIPGWQEGSSREAFDHNVELLAKAEYEAVKAVMQTHGQTRLEDLQWDPVQDIIIHGPTGRGLSATSFNEIVSRLDPGGSGVGATTLSRALVSQAALQGQISEGNRAGDHRPAQSDRRGANLDQPGTRLYSLLEDKSLFYSQPGSPDATRGANLGTALGSPEKLGQTLAETTRLLNEKQPGLINEKTHLFTTVEELLASDYAKENGFDARDIEGMRTAEGFHDTTTGHSVIIAENTRLRPGESPQSALTRLVLHERVSHAGLQILLGDPGRFSWGELRLKKANRKALGAWHLCYGLRIHGLTTRAVGSRGLTTLLHKKAPDRAPSAASSWVDSDQVRSD
ncbi:hypothetical protein EI77_04735 [Prosthecobacter fusiformis]|uniref:Large polyvalent protein associated domain-containing protein n=1 Tax=Prosthecobacter fusiformis TaxID=48464 RepID=A0A4R7RI99_9BACT|nr:hypothetical protein [Prosthecobacter fusiformis]TDU62105.1 hypothetical protein EI77_04735 [Prosthecobacter fusiformis]